MAFNPFNSPDGANPIMFRYVIYKRYLDYGRSLLDIAPIKYAIAGLSAGLAYEHNFVISILVFIIYAAVAFSIGMFWHRYKLGKYSLVTLEAEVANTFNDRFMEINEAVRVKEKLSTK